MNLHKKEKAELIKNGTFNKYREKLKEQWNNNEVPTQDPSFYGVSENESRLLESLERSTKKKKADFRQHARFIAEYYDNIGLLTLGFSNRVRDSISFDWMKQLTTSTLKNCFGDYIGKFEISPNGKIHAHFIVGWNGDVVTFLSNRQDDKGHWHTNTMVKKSDLQDLWFGEGYIDDQGKKQPTKYGIYDLVLIDKSKKETDKATNYSMKSLNTMESYIQKSEELDLSPDSLVDEELIFLVNTSNILTARNTPYQKWKKARDTQDMEIKRKARTFETDFYNDNKYNSKKVFREWAENNKDVQLTDYLRLFNDDFKIVSIDDYRDSFTDTQQLKLTP